MPQIRGFLLASQCNGSRPELILKDTQLIVLELYLFGLNSCNSVLSGGNARTVKNSLEKRRFALYVH